MVWTDVSAGPGADGWNGDFAVPGERRGLVGLGARVWSMPGGMGGTGTRFKLEWDVWWRGCVSDARDAFECDAARLGLDRCAGDDECPINGDSRDGGNAVDERFESCPRGVLKPDEYDSGAPPPPLPVRTVPPRDPEEAPGDDPSPLLLLAAPLGSSAELVGDGW